jgi:hypothetical protein
MPRSNMARDKTLLRGLTIPLPPSSSALRLHFTTTSPLRRRSTRARRVRSVSGKVRTSGLVQLSGLKEDG